MTDDQKFSYVAEFKKIYQELKGFVQKTLGDFTSKKSKPTPETKSAMPPKPPVDYKKLLQEKYQEGRQVFKELVALGLNKEIPIDERSKVHVPLLTEQAFVQKLSEIKTHLQNYKLAVSENKKEEIGAARAYCKNDKPEIDQLIFDLEQELEGLFSKLQDEDTYEKALKELEVVKSQKWKELVSLREEDEDHLIFSPDEFDSKFEKVLYLHAAIQQFIQSKS